MFGVTDDYAKIIMKKLFLTLIVAFATVCVFAQEKVWEDVVTGYSTSTVFDVNADPRNLDALENLIKAL
jgi:hypothetical protein